MNTLGGIDLAAAGRFMATHARLLDRRRFDLAVGLGEVEAVHAALAGYRNDDGGYGWGLEPDLRAQRSQPVGALHALEIFAETGGVAGALADWLASVTLPDGGLPFALPVDEPAGCAPWWVGADPTRSSLHLSTAIAAAAHRVAARDAELRAHPWLARVTQYCWREIREVVEPGGVYQLRYLLWFLDAVRDRLPGAPEQLARIAHWVPANGVAPVEGGIEGEALRPLDFSPHPGRPLRGLFAEPVVRAELARLASAQRPDGGWTVDHAAQTEAAALEWRGHATVRAVQLLGAHSDAQSSMAQSSEVGSSGVAPVRS